MNINHDVIFETIDELVKYFEASDYGHRGEYDNVYDYLMVTRYTLILEVLKLKSNIPSKHDLCIIKAAAENYSKLVSYNGINTLLVKRKKDTISILKFYNNRKKETINE